MASFTEVAAVMGAQERETRQEQVIGFETTHNSSQWAWRVPSAAPAPADRAVTMQSVHPPAFDEDAFLLHASALRAALAGVRVLFRPQAPAQVRARAGNRAFQ